MKSKNPNFASCQCHIIPDVIFKQLKKEGYSVVPPKDAPVNKMFREERAGFMLGNRDLPKAAPGNAARFIYDSETGFIPKFKLVRKEGDAATKDTDVNAAYDNGGIVREYFTKQMGWNSIDGNGLDLIFNVHFRKNYNNAFWNGSQMTFGDGDGASFTGFARALDVTGHELTHGVVQYTANLEYKNQSGALNEHFADVFGVSINQFSLKQTAKTADWLVGATCLIGQFKGKAIRSMKSPADPSVVIFAQPENMSNLYKGTSDNGGVHINSGIPNKAFYLVSMDIGTQEAALLWFGALKLLKPTSKFADLYKALVKSAKALIKLNKIPEAANDSLKKAFQTVGIIL